ncbi:asparagine synthase (glutamine-hydrolyzing) [Thalassospira indica]|uniref:asparagine synthase (glutamine-hydrolyzing) n=1 Tax=Thalassospira indica TaxID=1891279 RepID=A0ABN5NH56_9PROT|nr:asparagine synthase (glutamine-hydrolyzing) [Thalassospira indica]AXO13642.1 asparagine synthase (glutamine-hydrolyzing) [Thalassospira indica]OAZ14476.1 asparagine synthase [Thalassospira profundimaris]
MCGLIGIASRTRVENRDWLTKGRDAMSHRGPDDAGEWWSKDFRVGLGHRRLAIIDLSEKGHQPMVDDGKRITVVFNGEIYNYSELRSNLIAKNFVFQSHSDTEVLLNAYAAWGENCLSHIEGMFSFAIYDDKEKKIFLARDRAGEKPMYYRLNEGVLEFSSELKGLLENPDNPRQVDFTALDCYLTMGYVPGEHCILNGYKKLPPSHAMTFRLSDGLVKTWEYWSIPEMSSRTERAACNKDELLDELESLLEESVSRQMCADVPVGVLLSGGLDSSLVTAMAVRHSDKIQTFSVGFPGYGDLDETAHARLIADHFGTTHLELTAEATTADLIPRLACQFDEPMADSSMIPTWLVTNLVRQHCTVALGGDGGDELFGGYPQYSRLLWMEKRSSMFPTSIRQLLSRSAGAILPTGFRGKNYIQAFEVDLKRDLSTHIDGLFDNSTRRKLMSGYTSYTTVADEIYRQRTPPTSDLLQRATRMDFRNYLAEDILVKVDRASMLNSLEVRAPFLDRKLVEFAFAKVPSNLKAIESDKKILLKLLADRILPPQFHKQRKQGFSIPLARWLKSGPFRDLFWETLTGSNCVFDRSTIIKLFKGLDRGFNNGERLFALTQFELWRQHYNMKL